MAKTTELELAIKIAGKIDPSLYKTIGAAQGQVSNLAKGMQNAAKLVGAGVAAAATLAATGFVSAIKEAVAFEEDMAGVVKVTEGLRDENGKLTDTYYEIADAIQELSTQIPVTTEELTSMAAIGAQSGVPVDELVKYAEDASKMAIAFEMDPTQAGEMMAKWRTAFGMEQNEVVLLADEINYLANRTASSEEQISDVVTRIGNLGEIGGVATETLAVLGAVLTSNGMESENAATAIKRMILELTSGESVTTRQAAVLDKLGISATGLAEAMQEDSVSAMKDFLGAMTDLPKAEQLSALNDFFGGWAVQGVSSLANNLETMEYWLDQVSNSDTYAGSMELEYEGFASTTASAIQLAKNAWQVLLQDIGSYELDNVRLAVLDVRDAISDLIEDLPNIMARVDEFFGYWREHLPELKAMLVGIGTVWTGMRFAPQIELAGKGIGRLLFGKGGNKEGSGLGKLIGTGGLFGRGGIVDAARTGASMANSSMTRINGEMVTTSGAAGFAQRAYNNIVGGTVGILNRKKLFAATGKNAKGRGNVLSVGSKITGAKAFFPGVAKALGSGAATTAGAGALGAGTIIGGVLGAAGIGSGALDIYRGTQTKGKEAKDNYFKGGTKIGMVGAGAGIGAAIGSVVPVVGTGVGALIGAGVGGIGALAGGSAAGQALSNATEEGGWIYNAGQFITQEIPKWWSGVTDAVGTFFTQTVPNKLGELWDAAGAAITEKIPYAIGYAAGKVQVFFTQTVPNAWNNFWTAVGNFFAQIPTWASNIWNNNIVPFVTQKLPQMLNDLWTAVGNFFAQIPTWASNIWNNNIVPFVTQTLPQMLNDLWTSVGTFISETLPNLGQAIKDGFNNFVSSVGEKISGFFSGIVQSIGNIGSKIMGSAGKGYASATGSTKIPAYAAGGFTSGISIAGEAGTEAVISFDPAYRSANIQTWQAAGRMLGVDEGVEAKSFGAAPAGGRGKTEGRESNPNKLGELWDAAGAAITEKIPYAIGYAAGKVQVFFTQTVPNAWNNFWTAVGNFFAQIPTWASNIWNNNIVPFVTQKLPQMLNDLWTAVGNFFAQIPTWASNIWNNNIVPFVTQTLPQMLNDLWTSVGTFISETLPNLGQAIKDGFNNFVSSVGEKISGFFSGIVQSIGNIGSKIMGSAGKGYASATGSTKIPAYAAGGFTSGISIAGEAGTEAVISFDPAYRSANIQTWQAAGRMLGVDEGVEAKSFGAAPAGGRGKTEGRESNPTFVFSPNITIQGSANREDVSTALRDGYEQFKMWVARYERERRRTAY